MQANDVVRLRNVGTERWRAMYASQSYKMEPGGETIAPFIAACNWFGHPDAIDGPTPRDRYRSDEVARLRVYYGVYDNEELWETNVPKVEVYDLDGNRLSMVIHDPDGVYLTPTQQTIAEKQNLEAQLDALQRQMRQMQAAIDIKNREVIAEDEGDLISDDETPTPVYDPNALIVPTPEAKAQLDQETAVSEDAPTRIKVSSS